VADDSLTDDVKKHCETYEVDNRFDVLRDAGRLTSLRCPQGKARKRFEYWEAETWTGEQIFINSYMIGVSPGIRTMNTRNR
jgi:hypothetical protein